MNNEVLNAYFDHIIYYFDASLRVSNAVVKKAWYFTYVLLHAIIA
jgi:hypothetical protein